MYSWATPEKLLDEMSLDQWKLYYNHGWEAKQTENRTNWGILGQLLNGEDTDEKATGIKNFKESYPDGQLKDGAYRVSR